MMALFVWLVIIAAIIVAYRFDVFSSAGVLSMAVVSTIRLCLKFIITVWRLLAARH